MKFGVIILNTMNKNEKKIAKKFQFDYEIKIQN